MIELKYRIAEACKRYPGLSYAEENSGYLLYGILVLNAEYQDIPLYDEYLQFTAPSGRHSVLERSNSAFNSRAQTLFHGALDMSLYRA